MRSLLSLLAVALCAPFATAGGLTPEEAVKRFKLPEGFTVRAVATEPMVRQPVSVSFDSRGRMWVMQYLQYPHYAGIKPVKQDQYLRTVFDKVPEPPPHGPKGLDKLTICYDPDENGVFRKSKDFATGLNIASGFCVGNGGVYVAQPPYLLFYPDKNEDDLPDGDPEVLLSGFGIEDSHSLANSLQWGPDGWLYGAAGSTSTCKIANPANPKQVIEFQQGIWRYHPKTKQFELFSEGGGNTYGLDFDRHGNAIAGTNWGGFACLHQMQGAYYVKGFSKHGPLHNPHTYGYFDHVPYTGFKGGHVTCGGVLYDAEVYPEEYRGQYVAANLLSNAVYWHKLERAGSSFKAKHGGDLLTTDDTWFRPIDIQLGPDGCLYVVDWYDKRAAHLDPVDNWDKTNGRVYRIEYKGGPKYESFDLRKKKTAELVELLKHPNKWWRNEARRLLAERRDFTAHKPLLKLVKEEKGQLALEALWALYACGGFEEKLGNPLAAFYAHANEDVRAWAVRLTTDLPPGYQPPYAEWWKWLPKDERSPAVLAQIACSAARVPWEGPGSAKQGDITFGTVHLVRELLANPVTATDPQLPLLTWWAVERHMTNSRGFTVAQALFDGDWAKNPLRAALVEKAARRWAAGYISGGKVIADVLIASDKLDAGPVLRGLSQGLDARGAKPLPPGIVSALKIAREKRPNEPLIAEILIRTGDEGERDELRARAVSAKAPDAERAAALALLARVRDPKLVAAALPLLPDAKTDALRIALLSALESYDDPKIGETVLAGYATYSPAVKKRALQLLLARPSWAQPLFTKWQAGQFPKADLTLDHARAAVKLEDKALSAIVEKHFGKLAPATAGEKQARIGGINIALGKETGDATRGKVLFTKHCAACHQLFGEGGKVGPDLTTSDRKNRTYMLTHIVDPSGYIRPEYLVYSVLTKDDRKLSGIATETAEGVTLTNVVNDQVVQVRVPKADVAEMLPSPVSLMPEKLLDSLTNGQIADLFAYLSLPTPLTPLPKGRGEPEQKKQKVVMLSGSFEYESDKSLAILKKHLEAALPVECVIVSAKAEKDAALAGVDALATADVVLFFSRRLQIEGESLEAVKKYVASKKPIVGIRTASHGFQKWLEFDAEVLGGNYKGHFGKGVADVGIIDAQKAHPVLAGVKAFKTNGSIYKNSNVSKGVTVLLEGTMGKEREPVAWVREANGRRVFYTSLGHQDDFKDEVFLRLVTNGLQWAAKIEVKK
jgi:putative membrane-bound dehydrogenase-like protein